MRDEVLPELFIGEGGQSRPASRPPLLTAKQFIHWVPDFACAQVGLGSKSAGRRALITTAHHSEAADHGTKRDTG
jgi:hypothetical protein